MKPPPMTTLLCSVLLCLASLPPEALAADPPATQDDEVPMLIRDESAGDWIVDRFAGNTTAGPLVFQGPATEAGGCARSTSLAVAGDGRVYFPVADGVMQVSPEGVARLIVSNQEWKADGMDDLYTQGGVLAWNPKEDCLYFWGKSCIRKLIEKPDGSHEVVRVVGDPSRPGNDDGPAATATLRGIGNICINSHGTVFFYDTIKRYGDCLRKFENGAVSTISTQMRSGRLTDGTVKDATFSFLGLGGLNSVGENDDALYIADHWNFAARRVDLKADKVTTVFGMRKPAQGSPLAKRFGNHADGPALTHASSNSGCTFTVYDPVHKAVWLGGPDEGRLRWLRNGVVTTVMGSTPGKWDPDGLGNPADNVKMSWCWVLAIDKLGRAYVMNGASKTGYWRLYNRKEVGQ